MPRPVPRPVLVAVMLALPAPGLPAQMPAFAATSPGPEWQAVAGWDEVPMLSLRRASSARRGPDRQTRVLLSAGVPIRLALTGEHWTLGVGVERVRRFGGGWGLGQIGTLSVTRANTLVARATGLGLELGALPGRFGARGAVALDLRWRAALLTHLAHREPARALFGDRYTDASSGPPDGLLAGGGSRLQLGLAAGRQFGARTSGSARLGVMAYPGRPTVLVNPMLGQLPFYLTLGVGRTW